MFKVTKIIAHDSNGGRELHFPGKDINNMNVKEMKLLITVKLALPRDRIDLCDKNNNIIINKESDTMKKAFPEGKVRYKLRMITKIPSAMLKNVTLDKDENHNKNQIN